MLEYTETVDVKNGEIYLKLPNEFFGKNVLVVVQENKSGNKNVTASKKSIKKLINNPYNFDIDPESTFSREEIYD